MTLYKHQKDTAEFIRKHPLTFVTSDPGTGKTVSCLDVCSTSKMKTLVICPKTIMEAAWGNDIDEFYPKIKYGILDRDLQRKNPLHIVALFKNYDLVIINHDAVKLVERWIKDNIFKPHYQLFNRLIIDEFTAFKNKDSQRSKAMAKLSAQFSFKILLSGTPIPKNILDIWHPCYILDGGQRLGHNYFGFRNAICQPILKAGGRFVEWEPVPGAIEGVAVTLRNITIRHKLEEVVDMPERVYNHMEITMPAKLRIQYEHMAKHSLLQLQNETITAVNAAVLGGKLLQIASGSVYDNDGERQTLDTSKYELITQLVKEREHSIVFYIWQHQCDAMEPLFSKAGIKYAVINGKTPQKYRGKIIENYQAGMYDTLLVQPAAAAHGVTLTASTTTIWCSGTFNLEHFVQANYRDYRIGQKKRTEVIMVSYKDTVEKALYANLAKKRINQNTLLEILQK